ncbi:Ribosomal oxygenase 1 Bifunctional lysine-specific demethylase and histidyl-hydroxylase NO66 [Larimichthys crocea]|uniref:Bifunctional lysine-specific demethylase and histidyl-hydroxylase n=1 Tax=Larimichthys crocea TaxID=215358 RepID=A0A6G0I5S8_LARCR|nr:Ribosomal oxygenase 1 Bifunctional lysine-specific demethylase and histidyl-hydroxylase NO66 [Larimichthys crocea]
MEKTHMSAFALYQSLSTDLPPAKTASLQVVEKKKKRKRKENGVSKVNTVKAQLKPERKKMRKKSAQREESLKGAAEMQVEECVNGDSEDLDALLADLARVNNSRERASQLFQWLINPIPAKTFFRDTWEKKPILVQRKNPDYYKGLFSTAEFDRILRQEDVQYGVNLDVTSYTNGTRETHNPPGRALPFTVWNFYESGCSLRMLNPQAFSSTVWNALSILQEQFGSMAGANVYLTPPGTQGFAPHYDDIEAFIVQLEGKKHWRVYNPRTEDEVLPVLSSPNFDQSDIGKPILEVVLEAGDLLYFPRGFIHQGECLPDAHSLHITISSYQKNSWGDLMQKMVPAALEIAMEEDVEFRQGLPLDYLTYMGVQNSDKDDPRRKKFFSRIESLMKKLTTYAPVDAAVDQKARDYLHDCLPPMLSPEESASSVKGAPVRWERGQVIGVGAHITTQTKVRVLRAGCARLCSDGEAVHLYYTTDNSRVYHKEEPKSFEINAEHTDAIEFLIHSYPKFVTVGSFPCDSAEDKVALAELLFERGIIHTAEPL